MFGRGLGEQKGALIPATGLYINFQRTATNVDLGGAIQPMADLIFEGVTLVSDYPSSSLKDKNKVLERDVNPCSNLEVRIMIMTQVLRCPWHRIITTWQ